MATAVETAPRGHNQAGVANQPAGSKPRVQHLWALYEAEFEPEADDPGWLFSDDVQLFASREAADEARADFGAWCDEQGESRPVVRIREVRWAVV